MPVLLFFDIFFVILAGLPLGLDNIWLYRFIGQDAVYFKLFFFLMLKIYSRTVAVKTNGMGYVLGLHIQDLYGRTVNNKLKKIAV